MFLQCRGFHDQGKTKVVFTKNPKSRARPRQVLAHDTPYNEKVSATKTAQVCPFEWERRNEPTIALASQSTYCYSTQRVESSVRCNMVTIDSKRRPRKGIDHAIKMVPFLGVEYLTGKKGAKRNGPGFGGPSL